MLGQAGRTPYDMEFSCFGFPVRVHPVFFLMPLLLGRGFLGLARDLNTGVAMIFVVLVFFASILIHELGHAFAFRLYKISSRIVLYWLGGYAAPETGGYGNSTAYSSLTPNQHIVISAAGPFFGFALAGVLVILTYALGGTVFINQENFIPLPQPSFDGTFLAGNDAVFFVFFTGIILNILLNLFNLLPIYPLDGGQIARNVMVKLDAFNGVKHSLILSMACCVIVFLFSLMNKQQFMAIFFGYMAYENFQLLQRTTGNRW